jgi:ABC-type multidrug transport system fused ATPase/permease subunit
MARWIILKKIFLKHKLQLLITYLLFSLEMIGALLTPYFLGEAVNDLINKSYNGLIYLCVVRFLWMIVGVIRQRYDTRTYSSIYNAIVTKFLTRQINHKDVSKLSAHSTLAREFVDFLEHDLVYVLEAIYNIFGSLILLFFYDVRVVGICFSILIPVLTISYFYGKKMKQLNKTKNDELENQIDVIQSGNIAAIHKHYDKLRFWQIKISDKQAINFGIMEMLSIIVIALSLITTHKGELLLNAGSLIGMYSYVKSFVTGLDTIPYAVDKYASLNDIARRIEVETETNNDDPDLKIANN